jgi:hypothetical protein
MFSPGPPPWEVYVFFGYSGLVALVAYGVGVFRGYIKGRRDAEEERRAAPK